LKRAIAILVLLLPATLLAQGYEVLGPSPYTMRDLFQQYGAILKSQPIRQQSNGLKQANHATFEPIFVISAVGNSPGSRGTYFRSDVQMINGRNATQEVTLIYVPANQGNALSGGVRVSVPAGGVAVLRDVVGTQFNRTGIGTLIVIGTRNGAVDENALLTGFSRIYTPVPGGGAGEASQAFPALGANELLSTRFNSFGIGGRQDVNFRANLGIFNFSDRTLVFGVAVAGLPSGGTAGIEITVPPFSLVQGPVPGEVQGDLVVAIAPVGGTDELYNAYVSTNDNRSGDSYSANFVQ
jgi:hypothetical protein